ncbi:hypothetical protein SFUMM280S_07496 [Streptomyces fumanus]
MKSAAWDRVRPAEPEVSDAEAGLVVLVTLRYDLGRRTPA